jgi:predicted flap endonuclease-1-like 5' DNA nuclease
MQFTKIERKDEAMRVLRVFFLGLLYGWFMKWIIDEIYARDNLRMITNENALLRDRIKALEAPKSLETLSAQRPAPSQMVERPKPTQESASTASPAPRSTPARRANQKDDLKLIKGIGPQLEKKLNQAGVTSFDQMSRLTAAELQAILGISKRIVQNTDNLISQAKIFAQENTNR